MANPIVVVEYDPSWPGIFRSLQERIARALGEIAGAIEHVGSTAVPGLAAKPIIDIDVLLASADQLPIAIERLANIGYIHQGDLGIPEREAFKTPSGNLAHHLYVCPPSSREFIRHLAFRNYLRASALEAREYGELKKSLAAQFREDRTAYTDGKSEFVAKIMNYAMAFRSE